jgi:hypothetical protein
VWCRRRPAVIVARTLDCAGFPGCTPNAATGHDPGFRSTGDYTSTRTGRMVQTGLSGGSKMGYVSKTAVVSATVTIPARSNARSLSIVTGTPIPSTAPSAPAQQAVAKATPPLQVIYSMQRHC